MDVLDPGRLDEARSWTWDEFTAVPAEDVTVDIPCVTKWSKLDTRRNGVSVNTLLDGIEPILGAVERSRYAGRSWMPEEGLEPPTRGL